jgi:hypothetical protein
MVVENHDLAQPVLDLGELEVGGPSSPASSGGRPKATASQNGTTAS